MKVETFFEKLGDLVDAPEAVAKVRELILDLAFAGRLLPTKMAWPLSLLHTLASKIGSGATPDGGRESYFTKGIPFIRSMNVHFRGFDPTGLVFLNDQQAAELANVTVQEDDVLLNITGASIGRVTTAPTKMAGARVNQHVTIIRPTTELIPAFLAKFLASPTVQRMIDEIQVGATRQALTKGNYRKRLAERGIADGKHGAVAVIQRANSDLRCNPHYAEYRIMWSRDNGGSHPRRTRTFSAA